MVKVGLWNLEPRYQNLALEKIRLYHRKDIVEDNMFMNYQNYDKVYCSAIFDYMPHSNSYRGLPFEYITTGGTGFNLQATLPPEIEAIEPHLNFGFTTRGCIRKCKFCVVPEKEGSIKAVGDLLSLWDGNAKDIVLFDNNILALPEHFAMVCEQARQYKIRLDFNQGLDHRLLTPEIVDILKSISHTEYRFAFDHINQLPTVDRAITLLQSKCINRCLWYVLVGFDSTLEDDLVRAYYLKSRNQNAYAQRYKGDKPKSYLVPLARWVNQHHIFHGMTWEQFLNSPENKQYRYLKESQ